MSRYVFFFSYARDDIIKSPTNASSTTIRKLFTELSEYIRVRLPYKADVVGFMDEQDIKAGADFREGLRSALNDCSAFVYLHSPSYFRSEYCGKEFETFRRRVNALKSGQENRFVPIHWLPTPATAGGVPDEIAAMQRGTAAHGSDYNTLGLSPLVSKPARYRKALTAIADQCVAAALTPEQLPKVDIPPLQQIRAAFPIGLGPIGAGPIVDPRAPKRALRFARFVFVAASQEEMSAVRRAYANYHEGGKNWIPYDEPEPRSVNFIAQKAATEAGLEKDEDVPFVRNEPDLQQVIADARKENVPLVIIVDPWTLEIENYREMIDKTIGDAAYGNVSALIPWDCEDDTAETRERLINTLRGIFSPTVSQIALSNFDESITSQAVMRAELEKRLTKLRASIQDRMEKRILRYSGPSAPLALPILSGV